MIIKKCTSFEICQLARASKLVSGWHYFRLVMVVNDSIVLYI